ncbi:MAG TPA: DUF3108 domain-containing protein [Stellaceae bacterium]|nr:DUF3108 domain-containing protein [Stellaceae bacterium]
MTPRSPALTALTAALFMTAAPRPAAAEDAITMAFEGYGPAGLHVATTHTVIEETSGAYEIQGDFSTVGLGALFAHVANRSVTRGREVADKPKPQVFDSETDRDGVVQHLRVDYRSDGTPQGSASPPPKEPVTPVNFSQLPGTVDNLTAYLLLERQIAQGGSCQLHVPVFDGRHRYDLQFSDAGKHVLSPAEGQNFKGPTQACRMARQEIGGFYVDKNHEEGARSGTVWYAPLLPAGDIAVPVRMEMQTEIGGVTLFLAQLHGKGVNLKLMD